MPTGRVKFFNAVRGYGFIAHDEGGVDEFVHATALERAGIDPHTVREGDRLSFEIVPSRQGKTQAADVRKLEP